MCLKGNLILKIVAGMMAGAVMPAVAQEQASTAASQAPAPAMAAAASSAGASAPTPAATDGGAPATPKQWHFAGFDFAGFADGFYTWNDNHPSDSANGEMNDLYNFNQDADQPALSALKLTMDHAPAPVGAHFDFVYGRTNKLINAPNQLYYVEQAFLSIKPPKAKGFELDLGKFVTSAGAETIEAKDNWNYSRSLLFAWAIPYWHFGARTSMPVSKVETVGVQIVNGWNNIGHNTGGITAGFTSALVKPKYTFNLNVYTGPANSDVQHAYRNLFDTTLLLTPNSKLNAYVNFDLGMNKDSINSAKQGDDARSYWNGIAIAAHEQLTATQAVAARAEYFDDQDGFATGTKQILKEFTGTYEYHMKYGLISRLEYRHDASDEPTFHKGNSMTSGQSTLSAGLILILAPKR